MKSYFMTPAIIFCRQEVIFHGYLRVTRFCRKEAVSSNINTHIVSTLFICLLSSVCKAGPADSSASFPPSAKYPRQVHLPIINPIPIPFLSIFISMIQNKFLYLPP